MAKRCPLLSFLKWRSISINFKQKNEVVEIEINFWNHMVHLVREWVLYEKEEIKLILGNMIIYFKHWGCYSVILSQVVIQIMNGLNVIIIFQLIFTWQLFFSLLCKICRARLLYLFIFFYLHCILCSRRVHISVVLLVHIFVLVITIKFFFFMFMLVVILFSKPHGS